MTERSQNASFPERQTSGLERHEEKIQKAEAAAASAFLQLPKVMKKGLLEQACQVHRFGGKYRFRAASFYC